MCRSEFGHVGRNADLVGTAEKRGAAVPPDDEAGEIALPFARCPRLFAGGIDLSGGQWQRVALARSFFRDAPLVILDEPSAALDPRAEHALFATLRDVLDGRTALFISHRFSTVKGADRIVVLDEGAVVEQGTHDDLMDAGGLYADLYRLQSDTALDKDPPHDRDASPH